MKLRKAPVYVLILALLLTGCAPKSKPIVEESPSAAVTLRCVTELDGLPCEDFEFTEREAVEAFEQAIANAQQEPGNMNYSAEYEMQWSKDRETKSYHLSLGAKRDMQGLLVKLPDTLTGYSISVEDSNKLRDILRK
ncbi:hypothetical protein SAEN111111_02985 [Saccharibacillus endophyticus]